MGHPTTADGKPIFMMSLFDPGSSLYVAGAGDDPLLGRAKGPAFAVASTAMAGLPNATKVTWRFSDAIQLAGGGASWDGGQVGDNVDFALAAPASATTLNMWGKGDVSPGPGGILLPTPGSGSLNLVNPVPVPAADGLWCWSRPDAGAGATTAYDPNVRLTLPSGDVNTDRYHLLQVPVPLGKFIAALPIIGSRSQTFLVPAIKPQRVLPQWEFTVTVRNSGHTGLNVSWYVTVARMAST